MEEAENDRDGLTTIVLWRDIPRYEEQGAFSLDARTPEEFGCGAISEAVNIPHTLLPNRLNEMPKDRPIVMNCGTYGGILRSGFYGRTDTGIR